LATHRLLSKTRELFHNLYHAEGVQAAVFFEVAAAFGGGHVTEGHAEKFAAGRAAFLDREFVVALAGQSRQNGFHGGAAVLLRVVVAEAAKGQQQVNNPRSNLSQPRFELR